jgi:hypothetical protein
MKSNYDVVICGGGPAGIIAARAAAENGAHVLLIEKLPFLGGLASWGLVAPISEFRMHGNLTIGGFAWDFVEELSKENGADTSNGNIPFDNEKYKLVAARFLQNKNIDILLDTTIHGVTTVEENGMKKVTSIQCVSKCGNFSIYASYFIDCTGDAMVALFSGVKFQSTTGIQPASLCLKIANVNLSELENTKLMEHGKKYANTRIRQILDSLRKSGTNVPLFGGPWFQQDLNENVVYANMTRSMVNPNNPGETSLTEIRLREDAFTLFKLLKENVTAFKDSFIAQTGIGAGYRETRRIHGEHILTGKELLEATPFEDIIAHSNHPVDIHNAKDSRQRVTFLDKPGNIPFRSLYSKTHSNLLVAGRCISADADAFASVRVQASCMAMGQAAGTAAALCLKDRCPIQETKIPELLSTLRTQGQVID